MGVPRPYTLGPTPCAAIMEVTVAPIFDRLKDQAIQRGDLDFADANMLYEEGTKRPYLLMAKATEIREHFNGRKINLCSIVNAKSGTCTEDCRFCAQSAHYQTDAPRYPLLHAEEIIERAKEARDQGAHCFGIVTSGTSIDSEMEWSVIYKAISGLNALGIRPCASLGMLDSHKARTLKEVGLFRYHHNLETARSFFPNICTTHDYEEDIKTNVAAREAGLSVCCGGIMGLGETMAHRIELALTLRQMGVDSVPLNILNPIPGTPLECTPSLSPLEILATIAIFRFILPDKDIRLCGGKERNLRQLLPLGIVAGANALMTGNYLTTTGRQAKDDLEMVRDLGLEPAFE
jgi:biotin synthase